MKAVTFLLLLGFFARFSPGNSVDFSNQDKFILEENDIRMESQSFDTEIWISAPQWMIDLKQLFSLPIDEPIIMQAIKNVIDLSMKQEKFTDIIELLSIGMRLYPSEVLFPYKMGLLLTMLHPERAKTYLTMSKAEDQTLTSKVELVIDYLRTSSGTDALDFVHLGQVMGKINEWYLAESAFDQAVANNPQLADAWALLGQAKVMIGEDGYDQFSKALTINPTSPIALALISMYWKTNQRYDLALDYMNLLHSLQPGQVLWIIETGNLHSLSQDLATAFLEYKSATLLFPDEPIAWQNLAIFCLNYSVHLEDTALPAVRKVMELAPDDPLSQTLMGQMLIKQGDNDTAERFLHQALERDPDNGAAHYFLGYLFIKENNITAGFSELVSAIKSDGNLGYGKLARRMLEEEFGHE